MNMYPVDKVSAYPKEFIEALEQSDVERMAMSIAFDNFIEGRAKHFSLSFDANTLADFWEFYDRDRNNYMIKARTFYNILKNTQRRTIG